MTEKYSPIKEFLDARERCPPNKWFYLEDINLYLRKSKRMIEGELTFCVDIASVSVEHKGQGEFSRFLDWLISNYSESSVIFVESVLENRLNNFLERKGFKRTQGEDNNFWLPKKNTLI